MARVSLLNEWFRHYINHENPATYTNAKESARAAGYKTSNEDSLRNIGYQNFTKLSDRIKQWMEDVGLSENVLKVKMISLLDAKETKLQTVKGVLDEGSIAPNCRVLMSATGEKYNPQGQAYEEVESLVAVEMEALEIQRRIVDMGLKVHGSYAAEKVDVGGEVKVVHEDRMKKALERKAVLLKKKEPHG